MCTLNFPRFYFAATFTDHAPTTPESVSGLTATELVTDIATSRRQTVIRPTPTAVVFQVLSLFNNFSL